MTKFEQRAKLWGEKGLGIFFGTKVYNTYIMSTVGFVAQLEKIETDILDRERKTLTLSVWQNLHELGKRRLPEGHIMFVQAPGF